MDANEVPDGVVAEMLAGSAAPATIATLWSSCITPAGSPSDTLKDVYAPGYALPKILPRTVSFPSEAENAADYAVVGKLGEGGMGVVFEAEQKSLNRRVALKMIKPEKVGDPLARNCFVYEAAITAGLEHPGIVPVLEFGIAQDGRVFYTMKKATGVPWSRVIREKTLEENLAILDRVADVMAYAHAHGIIHRDLKPANILLGDFGEVWVGDWGVAERRSADGDYSHAHPGGTPQYMPPEMARCEFVKLGPASDVYLLGAILFEIVADRPPHAGVAVLDALGNAAANAVDPTGRESGLLPIIHKAMADEPAHRYAGVPELQQAIRRCLSENKGLSLVQRAEAQLAEAQRLGGYDLFQQALADYDAALAAFPDSAGARRGRARTAIAYGRQALANNEFDLALSIVQPEAQADAKAAALVKAIVKAKTATERLRRRRIIVNTILGIMVVALLLAGAYVARYRYDIIANMRSGEADFEQSKALFHLKPAIMNLYQLASGGARGAGTYKRQDLQEQYESLLPVLEDCLEKFAEEPWDTPAKKNRIGLYIRDRIPEIEEGVRRLRELGDALPAGKAGEVLQKNIDEMVKQFATVTLHLNRMALIGK